MNIIWLGHSSFRIEIGGRVLLLDPWLSGNPAFPEDQRARAIAGATHILLSHGHGDHAGNTLEIARELDIPILCIHELSNYWGQTERVKTIGFGKGGTIDLGGVKVTMVNACHSSSIDFDGGRPTYAGSEAGYMIAGDSHTIYFSGDTDIMADMEWMGDLHKPDVGILCAGGHYTMDMARAAYAAKRYFNFTTLIPCHYKTFPILEQSADALVAALPNVNVLTPEVMDVITLSPSTAL
jgi:L-ascorbate metabolism protein UlaG (beta-lactamase superfamily)